MKKSLLLFSLVLIAACSTKKKTQQALNSGNYSAAINNAVKNLTQNKTKKGHQVYVILLEEAFTKNAQREEDRIAYLKKDGNPANLNAIYKGYINLNDIQNQIQPLLPLSIYEENREAHFDFKNYDGAIVVAKNKLSEHLYSKSKNLLKLATEKVYFREAFEDLSYIQDINPGYKDVSSLMDEAYERGLEYVQVEVKNQTQQIIPQRLEEELLDFNTYGIDDFWLKFHGNPNNTTKYDYKMNLAFENIVISPERVNERQVIKEKQIKDGFEYVLDERGNVVKDSLGNDVKVDKFRTVVCNFYEFTQFKTVQVNANVSFIDLNTGQTINSYPMSNQFVFEHVYANYDGDKRALDNDLVALLDLAAVPFPTNEQMVYDAGEDLKQQIKRIIGKHRFY